LPAATTAGALAAAWAGAPWGHTARVTASALAATLVTETSLLGRDAIPPLPRLERLRTAILDATYGLCTQKAELMTAAMRVDAPQPKLTARLAPLHFAATRKTLEASLATGAPAEHWQLAVSKRLQQLWM